MMIYKIRIILDAQEDIFRDLEIEEHASLEELHSAITQAFGFLGEEMASFYTCDEQWNQDEEIPLFDVRESGADVRLMQDTPMATVLNEEHPRLLYVYDFLNLWTFFVELADIADPEDGRSYPNLLFSFGDIPESPPEKRFEIETDPMQTDPLQEDDDFGSYDDLDFEENWN